MISDYRFEYQTSQDLSGDIQNIFTGKRDIPQLDMFQRMLSRCKQDAPYFSILRVDGKDIEYAVQHETTDTVNIYLQPVNTQTLSNYVIADSGIPCKLVPEQRYFIGTADGGAQTI